jgi:hypothetical protein
MGFFIRLWLRDRPLSQQCMVFIPFALLGGALIVAGAMNANWRLTAFGFVAAVAWPLDIFVMRPISLVLQRRMYGDTSD